MSHSLADRLREQLRDYDETVAMPDQAQDIAEADLLYQVQEVLDQTVAEWRKRGGGMSADIDVREARLPKWARQELDRLRRKLRDQERRLTPDPTNGKAVVFTDHYDNPRPVAELGEWVRFYLDDEKDRNYIDVRVNTHGEMQLMGSDSLMVRCQASNTAAVVTDMSDPPRDWFRWARRRATERGA